MIVHCTTKCKNETTKYQQLHFQTYCYKYQQTSTFIDFCPFDFNSEHRLAIYSILPDFSLIDTFFFSMVTTTCLPIGMTLPCSSKQHIHICGCIIENIPTCTKTNNAVQ